MGGKRILMPEARLMLRELEQDKLPLREVARMHKRSETGAREALERARVERKADIGKGMKWAEVSQRHSRFMVRVDDEHPFYVEAGSGREAIEAVLRMFPGHQMKKIEVEWLHREVIRAR